MIKKKETKEEKRINAEEAMSIDDFVYDTVQNCQKMVSYLLFLNIFIICAIIIND